MHLVDMRPKKGVCVLAFPPWLARDILVGFLTLQVAFPYARSLHAFSKLGESSSYDRRTRSVEKDNNAAGAALVDSDAEPFPHLDSIR